MSGCHFPTAQAGVIPSRSDPCGGISLQIREFLHPDCRDDNIGIWLVQNRPRAVFGSAQKARSRRQPFIRCVTLRSNATPVPRLAYPQPDSLPVFLSAASIIRKNLCVNNKRFVDSREAGPQRGRRCDALGPFNCRQACHPTKKRLETRGMEREESEFADQWDFRRKRV